jgi:hypothetical protein
MYAALGTGISVYAAFSILIKRKTESHYVMNIREYCASIMKYKTVISLCSCCYCSYYSIYYGTVIHMVTA